MPFGLSFWDFGKKITGTRTNTPKSSFEPDLFESSCFLLLIVYFTLSLHFTPGLQSAVCILPSVCILPPVCSLQSAFYTDRLINNGCRYEERG